ncbi:peptidoglycan recognition protein family protein [Methylobacterium tarhaniae]|uniref:peptidoglycan recognition protein family protein n=1 Tax=Methylobacterium tarhaniae TaxID=1187852 RepID=UPI0009FB5CF3|nr:peptidoglycan recognition family protein [Methylobacterium tarhaniae]
MSVIPNSWMPDCDMSRIICHWSAGGYRASSIDRKHYHILIEKDGELVRGVHSIADNVSTSDGFYAAHTKGANTKSIGISVCCMAGAHESPFKPGSSPMTEGQWEAMAQVAAELADRYGIAITPKTVLGHGEVERELGRPQDGKWDPLVLPWNPGLSKSEVGKRFRSRVSAFTSAPRGLTVASGQDMVGDAFVNINGTVVPNAVFSNGDVLLPAFGLETLLNWSIIRPGNGQACVTIGGQQLELHGLTLTDEQDGSRSAPSQDMYLSCNEIAASLDGSLAFDQERDLVTLSWNAGHLR